MHGLVMQIPGSENVYDIISLRVQGTGLYFNSDLGFVHKTISERLRPNHFIEITKFNGTRTPLFLAGTGSFYYYYYLK